MAKFLEMKGKQPNNENKMQPGSRPDQKLGLGKDKLRPDNPVPERDNTSNSTAKNEVKQLAASLDVNLDEVKGTGQNGAITMRDVRQHHADSTARDNA